MIIKYKDITKNDINAIVELYINTFNSPPWNDRWNTATATKRIAEIMSSSGFYGLSAYTAAGLCGMIMGAEEQFYNGKMFKIKEFCVKCGMQRHGYGTEILAELENRLRVKGVSEIILLTPEGDSTEGFYYRRGYRKCRGMTVMRKRI